MNWQRKARLMRLFSKFPQGDVFYQSVQGRFGRLNPNPVSRILIQIEMAHWILKHGIKIDGKRFLEVGTGHKPIVPVGFFLCGAESVVTVDLNTRLDWDLTRRSLKWFVDRSEQIRELYSRVVDEKTLSERFNLIENYWSVPSELFKRANIVYLAPADAAAMNLPSHSIDFHFSVTTLEHIPPEVLKAIFHEASRLLKPSGHAIHFVDLSDHFQHQDPRISKINFLQYSEPEWTRIAGNRFAYCNRMRPSDYLTLLDEMPFDFVEKQCNIDNEALNLVASGFPLDFAFSNYLAEDLATTEFNLLLRRR